MNNNPIFITQTKITFSEYKKMLELSQKFYWSNVLKISLLEIIIIALFSVIFKFDIFFSLFLILIAIISVIVVCKFLNSILIKKSYEFGKKKRIISENIKVLFYEKYLIKKVNNVEKKLEYKEIKKIVETKENFYIYFIKNIIVINKNDLKEKNIEFIKKMKIEKKINIYDRIKILDIIFYFVIFSLFGAVFTINVYSKIIPNSLILEKFWVFWLWLPFSVISIILGFIKASRKNIISGFIVGIILFMFGLFPIAMPVGRIDYNKIKEYNQILNIKIPKDGDYIQNKYTTYFDLDKKNVIVTEIYLYNSKELKEFEKNIVKKDNWINRKKISTNLNSFIPYKMLHKECNNCYITIYNDETKEYNAEAKISSTKIFHVAQYNIDEHSLEINTYEFNN